MSILEDIRIHILLQEVLFLVIFAGAYTMVAILVGAVIAHQCRDSRTRGDGQKRLEERQAKKGHDLHGEEPDHGDVFRDAMDGDDFHGGEERRIPTIRGT